MTTIAQIITDAYRESNTIPIGQVPSTQEQDEALRFFNRFTRSLIGYEAGDGFTSYNLGAANVNTPQDVETIIISDSSYVPTNSRLVCNLEAPQFINLHPSPNDGARMVVIDIAGNFGTNIVTLNGNGRLIDGAATKVLNTNNSVTELFYRADTGSWMTISTLAITDVFPFPEEFEDLFVMGLALRINPRNGMQVDEQTMLNFRRLRNMFRARYNQTVTVYPEDGLVRLSYLTLNRFFPSS